MTELKKLSQAVVPDDFPPLFSGTPAEDLLRSLAEEVNVYTAGKPAPKILVERIKNAEAVVNIQTVQFTRWVLEQCPKLKILSIWAIGVDNVDLEACDELGITVTKLPPLSAPSVAEHTIALAMAVSRKIVANDQLVRGGEWKRTYLTDLLNRTLGVVGAGPIGQRVMQLGNGIGMNVIAWTLHPSSKRAREYGVEFVELNDLLRRSDVLAVCIALSEPTERLIGRRELELMKPTAIIVNTARGLIIDELAMVEALRTGRIAGAGLDVFTEEPLEPHSPLRQLDNVILSPHLAAATFEGTMQRLEVAVENIQSFMRGTPANVIVHGSRR